MVKKWILGILLLTVLFIGLSKFLGLDQGSVEQIASSVGYPFLVLQQRVHEYGTSWTQQSVHVEHVLRELEEVIQQRDLLSKKVIELSGFVRNLTDTQELREYLKRFNLDTAVYVPVLIRNFSGQNFFLVDAGEAAGVKKDMIALCKDSLIGKVTEVYRSYSKVLLITDPTCKIAVYCASNGVKGIHEGFRRGTGTLNFVDFSDEVTVGDLVLSSGEGGLFPRGFGLGTVTHSDSTRYGRSIVITPLIDLRNVTYCALVPNTISQIEPAEAPLTNNVTQESDK